MERAALLGGSVGLVAAATAGRIKAPEQRDDRRSDGPNIDIRKIWASVGALGASGFEGKDRKVWEHNTLASLGVRTGPHTEKMPYKMLKGVRKARKQREERAAAEAAAAGLVTGKKSSVAREAEREAKRARREADRPGDLPEPMHIRGPVMHLGASSSSGGGGNRDRDGGSRGGRGGFRRGGGGRGRGGGGGGGGGRGRGGFGRR